MAKKKRTNVRPTAAARRRAAPTSADVVRPWNWRTFPVFFALVLGLLIASIANGQPDNAFAAAVQIAALLGVGYGIAHLFVRNVVVAGRIRRRQIEIARGIEPKDDFEDEVVYPQDTR